MHWVALRVYFNVARVFERAATVSGDSRNSVTRWEVWVRAPFLSAGLEERHLIVSHGRHIVLVACVLVVITLLHSCVCCFCSAYTLLVSVYTRRKPIYICRSFFRAVFRIRTDCVCVCTFRTCGFVAQCVKWVTRIVLLPLLLKTVSSRCSINLVFFHWLVSIIMILSNL